MKKKKILIVVLFIIILALGFSSFFVYKNIETEKEVKIEKKNKKLLKDIKNHFGNIVKVNKTSNIYKLEEKKYNVIGSVSADEILHLDNDKNKIDLNTKYFYVTDYDFYIDYKSVSPVQEDSILDTRYKNYLLFDENVVSNDEVSLYYNGNVVYKLNYSIDAPIIRKDDDGVYIEYFNRLVLIKNEDIKSTYEKANNTLEVATSIPVTCYHFFYTAGDKNCNEIICNSEEQIRSHFDYLTQNNYFTLNTTELRYFIEGKLRLPKNSILVTIDDGARAEYFLPVLEEYKINATLFLITSWYDKSTFESPYMEIASHGHDLHEGGKCPGDQGSPIKCLDHDYLINDLTTSRNILNNTEAFCFPFYEYNDYAINILKEAGFKIAFIGGQKKATVGIDLYKVPRITIHRSTTLNEYINYIK